MYRQTQALSQLLALMAKPGELRYCTNVRAKSVRYIIESIVDSKLRLKLLSVKTRR
jgi:hypothetical protein